MNFRPLENGSSYSFPEDDDAGFGEYRSRPRPNTGPARSATLPNMSSPNNRLQSPRDDDRFQPASLHRPKGREKNLQEAEFDDPRYSAPPGQRGREDSLSSRDSRNRYSDGYGHPPVKKPAASPAKRKLYDYSSPDEGAGSRYDPTLDPFADEQDGTASPPPDWSHIGPQTTHDDSMDSYATPSDDDVFAKKKAPSSHNRQPPEAETLAKTKAQEDHAGYVTRKLDERGQQWSKNDYEDMTGKLI